MAYQSIFRARPVRRPGDHRHRRRQRHRALHRARAGRAGRHGGAGRPQAGEARHGRRRDRRGRRHGVGPPVRHPRGGDGQRRRSPPSSATHGRIDGLVNNAGGQFPAPLEDISQKGWETVVRTNLTGGFLMARECYTQWMREHGGRDRQHRRRHVARHAGHGPLGRRAGRHGQLHRDGGGRVGRRRACASTPWRRAGSPRRASTPIPTAIKRACCARCAATRRCSASARKPRCPRRSCSCCRRPPPSSPATRCASTAPRPTPSATSTCAAHDRSKPWNGFHRAVLPKVLREE